MGLGGQRHAPDALPPEKNPVPIVQEAGWAPGTVWTGAENLAPTGIRSPDRPARSESLYRLSYPGCLFEGCPVKLGPARPTVGSHGIFVHFDLSRRSDVGEKVCLVEGYGEM